MASTHQASNAKRLVQKTIKAHKRRGYADGGTPDLPDVGPPAIGDGGQFSAGTALGNKAADVGSNLAYGMMKDTATLVPRFMDSVQEANEHTFGPGPSTMTTDEAPWKDRSPALAAQTAMTLAGTALPAAEEGAAGIFGGKLMRTADTSARFKAIRMEKRGEDLSDIYYQTGLSKGADGQWRQEINDRAAKLKLLGFDDAGTNMVDGKSRGLYSPKPQPQPLSDAFHHPEAYEAYPGLGSATLNPMPEAWKDKGYLGAQLGNKIYLADGLTSDQARSVLLHEMQHWVQDTENFARGDSAGVHLPEGFAEHTANFKQAQAATEREIADQVGTNDYGVETMKNILKKQLHGTDFAEPLGPGHAKVFNDILDNNPEVRRKLTTIVEGEKLIDDTEQDAFSKYNRAMGEVESRNVEKRHNLTPEQRRETMPESTESVPRFLQRDTTPRKAGGGGLSFDDLPMAQPGAAAPGTGAAPAPAGGGLSFDDLPMAAPAAEPTHGTHLGELGKGIARGAEDFGGALGESVMGPWGSKHTLANLAASLGFGERPAPEKTYGEQLAEKTGMQADPKADTAGKFLGSIGEAVGNPSSYFGPGGWLSKGVMATLSGIGSEWAGEQAEGTGLEGPARIIGGMAAGPLAARVLKPNLAPAQQTLADRGVTQMTPGQLSGGIWKDLEDKLTSVPILGHFIQNARGRSIESFNRSVANQALEPIGEELNPRTAVGHDTISEVHDKISNAYGNVVPYLQLRPDAQWFGDLRNIYDRNVQMLPQDQIRQYQHIIDERLGRPAPLDGEKVKTIESELNHLAGKYSKSADGAQQLLGEALQNTVVALRQNMERMNPAHAAELGRINTAYAMYARMAEAAGNRRTSEGVFTPSDLLAGIKKQDRSVRKGSFARGDNLMQDFAEAGQRVLPSRVPDSGTTGRALASLATGSGLGYLNPKILAGTVAAGAATYNPLTMNLLNRYTRATPQSAGRIARGRANYSNVGRGVGTLRPLMQGQPYGDDNQNPYAP